MNGLLVPRRKMLADVEDWLVEDGPDCCVVTGPPGTGKSVFAGQLVTQFQAPGSDESRLNGTLCLAYFCDARDERTLDPMEFIRALSEALIRALPGFADAVAESLSETGVTIRNTTTFQIGQMQAGAQAVGMKLGDLSALGTRRAFTRLVLEPLEKIDSAPEAAPLVIVVDDLSAAYQYHSEDNLSAVLRLLIRRREGRGPKVRLVVTSRPDEWALQGFPLPRITLTRPAPTTVAELAMYARNRLLVVPSEPSQTLIDRVVEASDGNFLVAKHLLDDLMRRPTATDVPLAFPASLDDLYDEWVSRHLQSDRSRWRRSYVPVLGVIAVAQGAGFDASRIAQVTGLGLTRVHEVLEDCSHYLNAQDSGTVRFYHESFHEFLIRRKIITQDWHRTVAAHLTETYARNWSTADDYTRENLPYHAALAGTLASVITDPAFLIHAEPRAVQRAMTTLEGSDPVLDLYSLLVPALIGRSPGERAARLELAARSRELTEVAEVFADLNVTRPWRALWGCAVPSYEHEIIGRHPGGIEAMATLSVDGRPALASGGRGGSLRIWDLRLREPIFPDIEVDPFGVVAVSACRLDDGWVVLATGPFRATVLSGPGLKDRIDYRFHRTSTTSTTSALLVEAENEAFAVFGRSSGSVEFHGLLSDVEFHAQCHDGPVLTLATDPQSRKSVFISGSASGQALKWSITPSGAEYGPLLEENPAGWSSASAVGETAEATFYAIGYSTGRTKITRISDGVYTVETALYPSVQESGTAVRANQDRLWGLTTWSGSLNGNTYHDVLELLEQIGYARLRHMALLNDNDESHSAGKALRPASQTSSTEKEFRSDGSVAFRTSSSSVGYSSWQHAENDEVLSGGETLQPASQTSSTEKEFRSDGSVAFRTSSWSPAGDSCQDFLLLFENDDRRRLDDTEHLSWLPVAVRGGVTSLDVHRDPPLLASGGQTGQVGLMSLADFSGSLLRVRGGAIGAVVMCVELDGPALLAAESDHGTVTRWQLDPAGTPVLLRGSLPSRVVHLVALAEGRYTALRSETGDTVVMDTAQGEELVSLPEPASPGNALLVNAGPLVIRVMDGQETSSMTLCWIDLNDPMHYSEIHLPELDLVQCAVALKTELPTILVLGRKGNDHCAQAVTAEFREGSWHVLSIAALRENRGIQEPQDLVLRNPRAFALPDPIRRTWLIISDGPILALSVITGHVWRPHIPDLRGEEVDGTYAYAIDFLHQGEPAFLIPSQGELLIFEVRDSRSQTPTFRRVLAGAPPTVTALAASPDGRLLLAGGADGTLCWWRDSNDRTGEVDLGSPVRALAATGDTVISATDDHLLALQIT